MWVKICGTTSLMDAQLAVSSGADAVGFVFAPSKRRVTIEQVAEITPSLPVDVEKVGVFDERTSETIAGAVQEAGLTMAQLHFAHDPAFTALLRAATGRNVKLLQVIHCPVEELDKAALSAQLAAAFADENLWGVLLDASARGISGGTGVAFDWNKVAAILDEGKKKDSAALSRRLILAGGLNPVNVREAIRIISPFGVDVVSGVEAMPGKKDSVRVRAFIDGARERRLLHK